MVLYQALNCLLKASIRLLEMSALKDMVHTKSLHRAVVGSITVRDNGARVTQMLDRVQERKGLRGVSVRRQVKT